jgi:EspA/EspE family
MGLLDDAFDVMRRVGDVLGVNWEKGPGVFDKIPFVNQVAGLAGSPILAAAQGAIHAMKSTTGSGEPEDGAAFKTSAGLMEEGAGLVVDADPKSDRWDGTASETYEATNVAHRGHVYGVGDADREISKIVSDQANRVVGTRRDLDDQLKFLSDFDTATSWLNFVPGGAAVKASMDLATAAAAVATSQQAVRTLVWNSLQNAAKVREQDDAYQQAAGQEFPSGDACSPFLDDPRTDISDGHRPSRLDPEEPYTVPEPEGPPVDYPPARPLPAPAPVPR